MSISKKSIYLFGFAFAVLLPATLQSEEHLSLQKNRYSLAVGVDHYKISSQEEISLYGARTKKWLNRNWYWGETGLGAISGKRSGFIEGGISVGYQTSLNEQLTFDLGLFWGAGGGGDAPQGGGMIIQPALSVAYMLTPSVSWGMSLGYLHFMNGHISSPSLGFFISQDSWSLSFAPESE